MEDETANHPYTYKMHSKQQFSNGQSVTENNNWAAGGVDYANFSYL